MASLVRRDPSLSARRSRPPGRRSARRCVLVAVAGLVVGACSPAVTVHNGSGGAVHVAVSGSSSVELFTANAAQRIVAHVGEGTFHAAVISDADWVTYAGALRTTLIAQLARPDTMTGAQTTTVSGELDAVGAHIADLTTKAAGDQTCTGSAAGNAGAVVEIADAGPGPLRAVTLSCR